MKAAVVLFAAVAVLASGAGAGEKERAETDAWALVGALRSLSGAQQHALREGLVEAARRATRDFFARLDAELAPDAADLEAAEAVLKRPEQRSFGEENSINAETIRRILTEGLPSSGIPPLDPLQVSYVPLNLDIPDVLSLQASIEDLKFEGLSSFVEDIDLSVKIGIGTLQVIVGGNVTIPVLHLRTKYEADANLELGLDIWGDGFIDFLLNLLRVEVNVGVKGGLFNSPMASPCTVGITTRGIELDIEGLLGDGELSQQVGEIISDMVNEVLGDVLDQIASIIESGISGYIESKSTVELISLLMKITSMPLPDDPSQW